MPTTGNVGPNALLNYQTVYEYKESKKLFEHIFLNGKLVNSKYYYNNFVFHEQNIDPQTGLLIKSVIYQENGKLNYELSLNDLIITAPNQKAITPSINQCKIYNDVGSISYQGSFKELPKGRVVSLDNIYQQNLEDGITSASNCTTEGFWKNNFKHGKGTTFYDTGKIAFEGTYEFGKRNGYGVSYYKNANKSYEGFWKADIYANFGKLYYESGILSLEGYFSNNRKNFKGIKYNIHGGKIYEGEMLNYKVSDSSMLIQNYKSENEGTSYYVKTGTIKYHGYWDNDLYHDFGTLYHENAEVKYQGSFKFGKFHGRGQKYDYSGSLVCRCKWKENKIDMIYLTDEQIKLGYSILDVSDNCWFIGMEKNGRRNGYGFEFTKTKGVKTGEGNYIEDTANGFGKSFWVNDEFHSTIKYIGNYEDSDANGAGCFYYPNGKLRYRGKFKDSENDYGKFHVEYLENGMFRIEENYKGTL